MRIQILPRPCTPSDAGRGAPPSAECHKLWQNGNADNHTDQAEEIPADDNREENPERRDANRIAENHRADEIAIQLLDNQNQNQENQRLPRIEEEQNHRAGYRADERAEHGDDVRDADNDADERRVRQAEDVHADKRQYTNNRGIEDFSGEKAAEIAVCVVAIRRVVSAALFGRNARVSTRAWRSSLSFCRRR